MMVAVVSGKGIAATFLRKCLAVWEIMRIFADEQGIKPSRRAPPDFTSQWYCECHWVFCVRILLKRSKK